jgi:hypothetical protein
LCFWFGSGLAAQTCSSFCITEDCVNIGTNQQIAAYYTPSVTGKKCRSIWIDVSGAAGVCTTDSKLSFTNATATWKCPTVGSTYARADSCVAVGTSSLNFDCCSKDCGGTN